MAKAAKGRAPEHFDLRWDKALRDLTGPLSRLYGVAALDPLLARLREMLMAHAAARPKDLAALDRAREIDRDWFQRAQMAAYVFYIDRFAGRMKDLPDHIDYLRDLGITYVHLMPCLMPRPGDSDGGYAVMDYRRINPSLGDMDDLEEVTAAFRKAGISTCIDMVLNHTAKEHAWAEAARAGDPAAQAMYLMFDDDRLPKQYEETLVEVFPDQAPGSFTHYPDFGKWVWTTFNEFQWDLNWANPEVFLAITDTILFLANKGVEVFRLDAVAFMWKRMGTNCQNLPEVHDILQALVTATRAAAPGIIHKAEAIVAPRDLVPYLGQGTKAGKVSQLAYHNSLMVQFWSSLAARDTRLITQVLARHFPQGFTHAGFATYIRCHDDIGWAITDEDAAALPPMTGRGHRGFLADFYNGSFPGSFARGADFQSNPETGDRRTNGSFASLAGLEAAITPEDETLAIERILMGHALIASFGGIPLIYMGDELGLLNDHSYEGDPALARDGRWMHRPRMDWTLAQAAAKGRTRTAAEARASRLLAGTKAILAARAATPQLASWVPTVIRDLSHPALFAFDRADEARPLLCLFNFSEVPQAISPWGLRLDPARRYHDVLAGQELALDNGQLKLPPYGRVWLRAG